MRGRLSRMFLLASALLLLCSVASYSQVYHGPDLPEGWTPVPERVLDRIDEIFRTQQTQLTQQAMQLDEAALQLIEAQRQLATAEAHLVEAEKQLIEALQQSTEAESLLTVSQTALKRAGTSSLQLGEAITSLTRQRNLALGSSGLLAVLALWLAVR